MSARERAVEALRKWKCGGCSGNGRYRYDPQITSNRDHCVICRGSGLNPIAAEALAALTADTVQTLPVPDEGWRPIADAPKDGTEIDVWIAAPGKVPCRVPQCHWHCGEWLVWGHDPEIGWLNVETTTGCKVTHFRRLPAPPMEDKP